ncbi:MAG: Burkholderia phage Bp-AMP1 [Pseudomonadota bacterium]|jgi:hypothetical protein
MTAMNAQLGQALKAQGMQAALDFSGPWQDEFIGEFRAWLLTEKARGMREITIERFRAECKTHPNTSKAWGSAPGLAVRAGLLRPTDRFTRAIAPKTRGHFVRIWEIAL